MLDQQQSSGAQLWHEILKTMGGAQRQLLVLCVCPSRIIWALAELWGDVDAQLACPNLLQLTSPLASLSHSSLFRPVCGPFRSCAGVEGRLFARAAAGG